jgi:hypothetical protein
MTRRASAQVSPRTCPVSSSRARLWTSSIQARSTSAFRRSLRDCRSTRTPSQRLPEQFLRLIGHAPSMLDRGALATVGLGRYAKRSLHRPSWLSRRARTSLHSEAGSPFCRAASARRSSSATQVESQSASGGPSTLAISSDASSSRSSSGSQLAASRSLFAASGIALKSWREPRATTAPPMGQESPGELPSRRKLRSSQLLGRLVASVAWATFDSEVVPGTALDNWSPFSCSP